MSARGAMRMDKRNINSVIQHPLLLPGLAAVAMTALALFTRSFWGDELFSIRFSQGGWDALLEELARDYHPPLYFALLRLWMLVFGDGEAGLRVFQGMQALGLLWSAGVLFRQVFPSKRIHPLFVLLLLSVELWLFLPMLRYYALAAMLATLATAAWLRVEQEGSRRNIALLALLYTLVLYTDYPSSMIILLHAAATLLRHRAALPRMLLSAAIAGALFLPWAGTVLLQLRTLGGTGQVADLNSGPVSLILKIGYGMYAFILGETVYPVEHAALLALLLLAVPIMLAVRAKSDGEARGVMLLFAALALGALCCTALITTFVSRHTSFIYTPARTLYALPLLFVALAAVYEVLPRPLPRRMLVLVLTALSLYGLGNLAMLRQVFMPVYAVPWREVVDELAGRDGVLLADELACVRYYHERLAAPRPRLLDDAEAVLAPLRAGQAPDSTITVHVFLTERESTAGELSPDIISLLTTHGRLLRHDRHVRYDDTYRWIKSTLLRRPPGEAKLHVYEFVLGRAQSRVASSEE